MAISLSCIYESHQQSSYKININQDISEILVAGTLSSNTKYLQVRIQNKFTYYNDSIIDISSVVHSTSIIPFNLILTTKSSSSLIILPDDLSQIMSFFLADLSDPTKSDVIRVLYLVKFYPWLLLSLTMLSFWSILPFNDMSNQYQSHTASKKKY